MHDNEYKMRLLWVTFTTVQSRIVISNVKIHKDGLAYPGHHEKQTDKNVNISRLHESLEKSFSVCFTFRIANIL